MAHHPNRSNSVYSGFQAVDVNVGSMYDVSSELTGPFFQGTVFGGQTRQGYPISYKSAGKLYLEIQVAAHPDFYEERQYVMGMASVNHSKAAVVGATADSWVYNDRLVKMVTNGVETAPPVGWTLFADSYYLARLAIAVDFDAGKLWFASARTLTSNLDWFGDPVAGTGALFTFTPNLPLGPVIAIVKGGTGQVQYQGAFATTAGYCFASPPTGYAYWDAYDAQQEVLADAPLAYWLASPVEEFLENPTQYYFLSGSHHLGLLTANLSANSASVERYPYFLNGFADNTTYRSFPSALLKGYATTVDRYVGYPATLSSAASFTFLARIEVTGAGRIGGGANTWKEGSYLLCNVNGVNPTLVATLDADVWMGVSLRDRRLKFGVGASEVTSPTDLANGFYLIGVELDVPNSTLRLWINGSLAASATGYTDPVKTASWFGAGSTVPTATGGQFPGYFREIAVFDKVLNSTRHDAVYAHTLKGPMPVPMPQRMERVGMITPNFMR